LCCRGDPRSGFCHSSDKIRSGKNYSVSL